MFILGLAIGFAFFSPQTTGALTECYVENELCDCDETKCVCGNHIVEAEYCLLSQSDH